jgi:hypothetical protein
MEPDDEPQSTSESSSEAQEPSQPSSRNKLRDLRPEKDPMGAGKNTAPATAQDDGA